MTEKDLQELNRATFDAFIESGSYALTRSEADKQFGATVIDTLLSMGILENSGNAKGKKRYYISDIVSGITIIKNKTR